MQQRDVAIIGDGPAGLVVGHALDSQNSARSATRIKDEQINVNNRKVAEFKSRNADGLSVILTGREIKNHERII